MSSIFAGSPERRASTLPSRRLRTQPARPSDSAVDAVQSRNPTPVTRPFTTTRTAFRAGSGCGADGGVAASGSAEDAMARWCWYGCGLVEAARLETGDGEGRDETRRLKQGTAGTFWKVKACPSRTTQARPKKNRDPARLGRTRGSWQRL
uniref:Uncharacterized protein n=1 Tax=Zea mays TaxID=4577 RepID=B6TZM1_MAIZE|nr:hypothetical protein [Zea mays]